MKKTIALLTALLLLLPSCSTETVKETGTDNIMLITEDESVSSRYIDLNNLQLKKKAGVIDAAIDHIADLTSFKTDDEVNGYITAPLIYADEQYTHLIRSFPEELASSEEYEAYASSDAVIREIEIYYHDDYSEPVEIVPLEGLEETYFIPYALTYDSRETLYHLVLYVKKNDDFIPVFYTYSREGKLLDNRDLSINIIEPIICCNGKVYSLKNNGYSGMMGRLVCTDPVSGVSETVDESVICMFISDNVFYYIKRWRTPDYRNVPLLCSYDPESKESSSVMEVDVDKSINSASYDKGNGILYFSDMTDLYAYQNGKAIQVLNTVDAKPEIITVQGDLLFTRIGNNQLAVYQSTENLQSLTDRKKLLNICCVHHNEEDFTSLYQDVIDTMHSAGIPIEFNFTYITDSDAEYANTMAKKFLAGDTDFDLFYVSSAMSELFEKEYYEDLGSYDVLESYYDKMLPGIKELSCIDDRLALLPTNLIVTSMVYALENLHEIAEYYDELYAIHDEVMDELPEGMYYIGDSDDVTLLEPWFNELASNFMAGSITDETAEQDFIRLFEDIKQMNGYKGICLDPYVFESELYLEHASNSGDCFTKAEEVIGPLPIIGEAYKHSVDGKFLAVNPNAANKELALQFAAYFLHNGMTDTDSHQGLFFEGNSSYYEDDMHNGSYDSFRIQVADSIHMTEVEEYYDELCDLRNEMMADIITPSEAASRTLRYLKMVRDE